MDQRISLAHGEGGELTNQLIKEVFVKAFGNKEQTKLDSAMISCFGENLAVTTDSYVVKPLFFPGGDIGKLAITGTVNDLAVSGAKPCVITAGFIIEEGFLLKDLQEVVKSMEREAKSAGVQIVAGDTKVVEKGNVDGLFINTTGIGMFDKKKLEPEKMKKGDSIIVSGTIGDHGVAIISAREDLGLLTDVESDCASLNYMIQTILREVDGIRMMRDLTRGGLATSLVELCEDFQIHAEIEEYSIPIRKDVEGVCDILGFDPLYLANEGKIVIIVDSSKKDKVLDILHSHELGKGARKIGSVTADEEESGKLLLRTPIHTTRRLHRLSGLLLPRIC